MSVARAAVVGILLLLFAGASPVLGAQGATQPAQRWIVQLKPGLSTVQVASTMRAEFGQPVLERFTHVLNGYAVSLTDAQRDRLAADPRVLAVVPDRPIHAASDPYQDNPDEVQPGLQRVGAPANVDRGKANLDVDIAVLDTGIQVDNPELNVVGGYDCTGSTSSPAWADPPNGIGHGTHVAGIAAAIEDGKGVTGVAQGARLWSIKVLDGTGNGYWSSVICGLDYVASLKDSDGTTPTIEVVNMSLAGPGSDDGDCGNSNADLLHQAVCNLSGAGVTMVAAAGNESRDASTDIPAAYDEVITVAAMSEGHGLPRPPGAPNTTCGWSDANDSFAAFSNYGADVDLIAPGECVWSTAPDSKLRLMSGTSMATPHVAGGAALYYLEEARLGRPRPTPQQVRAALIASGTADWTTASDPDAIHEPALNVSNFDALDEHPAFSIGTKRQVVRASAGSSTSNPVWIAGVGDFEDSIDLAVDAPDGIDATFGSPSAASSETTTLSISVAADLMPGSYQVTVTGTDESTAETEHASFTLIVYNTAVDAGGPVITLVTGVQSSLSALPVVVRWPSVKHATKYRVEVSTDEGPWSAPTKTTSAKLTTTAWPGRRYQYRVQAKVHGAWQTAWQMGPSSVVNAIEPSTLDVTPTDRWVSSPSNSAYSEEPIYSSSAHSTAFYNFTGTAIAWMAITGPSRGKAVVTVDGKNTTVDLYSKRTTNRVLVFSAGALANGPHTMTIEVLGRPVGRPRVDIDSLLVVAN